MKETKLSIAHRLVLANPDKSLALSEIMNILGVSKSNAFVYYTKVTRPVVLRKYNVDGTMTEVNSKKKTVGKTTHSNPDKVVINPVTLLKPIRKALKINEIDAFISQLPKTPSFMPV
jgi:hypothetical protein